MRGGRVLVLFCSDGLHPSLLCVTPLGLCVSYLKVWVVFPSALNHPMSNLKPPRLTPPLRQTQKIISFPQVAV